MKLNAHMRDWLYVAKISFIKLYMYTFYVNIFVPILVYE